MDRRLFLGALLTAAVGQRLLPAATPLPEGAEATLGAGDRLLAYSVGSSGFVVYQMRPTRSGTVAFWQVSHITGRREAHVIGIATREEWARDMADAHFRDHYWQNPPFEITLQGAR